MLLGQTVLDLETRLTDALSDMVDTWSAAFRQGTQTRFCQRYVASAGTLCKLMRRITVQSMSAPRRRQSKSDAFEAEDDAVGWPKIAARSK